MKLKSIISKLKKGETEVLDKIKVTKYIPFATKRAIVKNVALQVTYKDENIFDTESNELIAKGTEMLVHDLLLQELLTFSYKIAYLTDITVDGLIDEDNIINIEIAEKAYDDVCSCVMDEYLNLYQFINTKFTNDDIESIISHEVKQELERNNSTANVLKNVVEDLVSKLPTQEEIGNLMTQIPNQLESLKDLKILNKNNPTELKKEPKDIK